MPAENQGVERGRARPVVSLGDQMQQSTSPNIQNKRPPTLHYLAVTTVSSVLFLGKNPCALKTEGATIVASMASYHCERSEAINRPHVTARADLPNLMAN